MRKHLILIGAIIIGSVLLVFAFHGEAESPADAILRQAYELRMKAQRAHCTTIGEKIASCYSGKQDACKKATASQAWFTTEYQETPEVACASEDRPFGTGGERR